MIRNAIMIIVFAVSSLLAALGSGPFIRTGVGFSGLSGTDLYIIPTEDHYREITADSLMVYYEDFSRNGAVIRPVVVFGWEQSFNQVLSITSGIGLVFSGASWETIPTTNEHGQTVSTPAIDASLKMTYITVPIETKLMLPLNSGGFCASFGPNFAFLSSARFENRARSTESDDRSLFRPWSMGLGGSFGGEIQLRKLDLLMALRIDGGLTSEAKDEMLNLRHFTVSLDTGLRWTTKRLTKSSKWPL